MRLERGLSHTNLCELCKEGHKSLIHALRDCSTSMKIWRSLVPVNLVPLFFRFTDVVEWVSWCLSIIEVVQGFEFNLWFAVICRTIWLRQNEFIFKGIEWSVESVVACSHACLCWGRNQLRESRKTQGPSEWRPPTNGIMKFNVDGSRNSSTCECSCGGILRDHHGAFVHAFQYRCGRGSVISAES